MENYSKKSQRYVYYSTEEKAGNVISSFLCANTEHHLFGELEVPVEFHNLFGKQLSPKIILICKEGFYWEAKYFKEDHIIAGLQKFFRVHEVKRQYLILFDYMGNNKFSVKIYQPNGVEIDYLAVRPLYCKSERDINFKESEYLPGSDEIEEDKAKSLIRFNGVRCRFQKFERKLTNNDMIHKSEGLVLGRDLAKLYDQWQHGDIIKLRLVGREWEIQILKINGICTFGRGWDKVATDLSLEIDDSLVCYTKSTNNVIDICIFKAGDISRQMINADLIMSGGKNWSTSFFHFTTEDSVAGEHVVIPLTFEKLFYKLIHGYHHVECGGIEWGYIYIQNGGRIWLWNLMKFYEIGPMNTILFICRKNMKSQIRIYKRDGMELQYNASDLKGKTSSAEWFMDTTKTLFYEKGLETDTDSDSSDSETEYGQMLEDQDVPKWTFQFTEILSKTHVDKQSHGVYIPAQFERNMETWENKHQVTFETENGTWQIGINITNGRKRFSSGWNKFIRENKLKEGDALQFKFDENESHFLIQIL